MSQENGTLAKRIIERQPVMGRKDWEGSSQQNNVYLNNIAKYHVDWHLPKVRRNIYKREIAVTRSECTNRVNPTLVER